MRLLVLGGGPAAGKSTCGRALAEERVQAAFIDADDVRQLVVAGEATLQSGPDGVAQSVLAAANVAAMGRNFSSAGFEVVVADVVTPASLAAYRDLLPGCFVVHLRVSLAQARRRAATRAVYLSEVEFDAVHAMIATPRRSTSSSTSRR